MDKRILIVDDHERYAEQLAWNLDELGMAAIYATSIDEAIDLIKNSMFELVVLDLDLPPSDSAHLDYRKYQYGYAGLALGDWVLTLKPGMMVLGCSGHNDESVQEWFQKENTSFYGKENGYEDLLRTIQGALQKGKIEKPPPKVFIVHGHDQALKLELKDYLQNTLKLGEPIILDQKPNWGRTVMEKFEEEALNAGLVFVLITPDDLVEVKSNPGKTYFQPRPNVIFEMGYFMGKLGRKSGRVILLHKGDTQLHSDIIGVVYINVNQGVESAGEQIRKELKGIK